MSTDVLNTLEFIALLALVLALLAWSAEKWLGRDPKTMADDSTSNFPPGEFDLYGSLGFLVKAIFVILVMIFLGAVLLVAFIYFG